MKNISWRAAWKNEENVHLRFLIFETSLHRSLQNKLRDFQKWWIYEKYENCPFYRLFWPYMVGYDKKKYFMTINMEKRRKYTSQNFGFSIFITEIFANKLRDFQKTWNNEKTENCPFSWQFFHQNQLDMANRNHLMTISMKKWSIWTPQILDDPPPLSITPVT